MEKLINESRSTSSDQAVIIDLGKKKKKAVKNLCKGRGKLLAEVHECIDELRSAGEIKADVRPVIIVVREKSRRPRWF